VLADGAAAAHSLEASTQARLAHEVEDLRAQQAREREILSSLARQRSALQAEVDGVQRELEVAKQELAGVRSRQLDLEHAQERGRKRLLEAVTDVLNQGLLGMEQEMKEGSEAIQAGLDKIEASTSEACSTTERSRSRAAQDADEVAQLAGAWKEASHRSCEALEEVGIEASQMRVVLAELHANVSSHQLAATEEVGAWEADGLKHAGALDALSGSCAVLDAEDGSAEGSLAQSLCSFGAQAGDVSARLARARGEADFLVKAVEGQASVLRDLGEAAGRTEAEASLLNTDSLSREEQELTRGRHAKVRTVEQLEEFRTGATRSLEEQRQAMWSGFSAPPLSMLDGPGAEEKADLSPPPASRLPAMDIAPRRSDEQLQVEFSKSRRGGGGVDLDKENSFVASNGKVASVGGGLRELNSEVC